MHTQQLSADFTRGTFYIYLSIKQSETVLHHYYHHLYFTQIIAYRFCLPFKTKPRVRPLLFCLHGKLFLILTLTVYVVKLSYINITE